MLSYFKANKKEEKTKFELDADNIPHHVAIIMDGNGRWAKAKNLPRTMGHKAGVETIRRVIKEADKLGVKYITLYAFSTENWKRPKDEVNALMKLLVQYLRSEVSELHRNKVVLRVLGDITALADECRKEIEESIELTKNNTGLVLNFAFNYGGRDEIIRAVKNVVDDVQEGKINKENITQELFANYLYTKDSPDPDLIIRPSGEQRLSNFLLWQCAYSEFWYSNINWPDFSEKDLQQAIYDYQNRDRRFGGV
ncbi:MAG: isoprenyl transferase [Clostridium sp.]|uniref:isoprenyl transferase n=1 Tax=Clostridium sp. TaxID=1506 RepID=UPI00399C04F1